MYSAQVYSPTCTQPHVYSPKCKSKVNQLRLTLCDPLDYTVHGILQAIILEWVAFPFFRGSSQPRDQTRISCIAGRFFSATWETLEIHRIIHIRLQEPKEKTEETYRQIACKMVFMFKKHPPAR